MWLPGELVLIAVLITIPFFFIEPRLYKRAWRCQYCKGLKLIWSDALSPLHGSQHLLDWYSATHVCHGLTYGMIMTGWLHGTIAEYWFWIVAWALAVTWELIENSPCFLHWWIGTDQSQFYKGDAILNSFGDCMSVVTGMITVRSLFHACDGEITPTMIFSCSLFALLECACYINIHDSFLVSLFTLVYNPIARRVAPAHELHPGWRD